MNPIENNRERVEAGGDDAAVARWRRRRLPMQSCFMAPASGQVATRHRINNHINNHINNNINHNVNHNVNHNNKSKN